MLPRRPARTPLSFLSDLIFLRPNRRKLRKRRLANNHRLEPLEERRMLDGAPPTVLVGIAPYYLSSINRALIFENSNDDGPTSTAFYVLRNIGALDPSLSQPLTINYTIDGTAESGDYETDPQLSGTIVIPPYWTYVDIPTVTAVDDDNIERDEDIELILSPDSAYEIAPNSGTATITIVNDDIDVSVNNASVVEGTASVNYLEFAITVNEYAYSGDFPLYVHYYTVDSTAAFGSDYVRASNTLTFLNEESQTVRVQIIPDDIQEQNETMRLVLDYAYDTHILNQYQYVYALTDVTGTGTIENDDTPSTKVPSTIATNDGRGSCPVGPQLDGGNLLMDAGNSYFAPNNPHPIITLETQLHGDADYASITSFDVELTLIAPDGAAYPDAVSSKQYNVSNLTDEELLRFALQVDASAFPTSMYRWEMAITTNYSNQPSNTDVYDGTEWVTNWIESPFGAGRWLDGLEVLYPTLGGIGLVYSHGGMTFFPDNGQGGCDITDHGIQFFVINQDDTYTITYFDGTVKEFDEDGRITSVSDRNSNETIYTYVGDYLSTVTDTSGRVESFTFDETTHLLSRVTDFAGRRTDFEYYEYNDVYRLTSILLPAPAGGTDRPEIEFEYDETTEVTQGLLIEVTNELGESTQFSYDEYRRLASTTAPAADGSGTVTTSLISLQSAAADTDSPIRDLDEERQGSSIDEFGRTTVFSTDRFGFTTYEEDQEGNATTFVRKETCGRIDEAIYADPDGAGPRGAERTLYTYDTMFKNNITELRHVVGNLDGDGNTESDDIVERWRYGIFGQVVQHVGPEGQTTNYLLDEDGNVTMMIEVGDPTDPTDDLITRRSYTVGGNGIPKGLIASETSPTGATTGYSYFTASDGLAKAGQLARVLHPDTTPVEQVTPVDDATMYDDSDTSHFTATTNWQSGSSAGREENNHYILGGTANDTATWTFGVTPGRYHVSATWPAHPQYWTADAAFSILDGTSPRDKLLVNQRIAPDDLYDDGSFWEALGVVNITGTSLKVVLDGSAAQGYTIADGVRIQRVGDLPSGPELAVLADGRNIADESGYVALGVASSGASVNKAFTVVNVGSGTLNLGDITLPSGYTLVWDFLDDSLASGESTSFAVYVSATAAGDYAGQISFDSNDSDEDPFNFTIAGSVAAAAVIVDDDSTTAFTATSGWVDYNVSLGYGQGWHYAAAAPGTGSEYATWTFTVTAGQYYRVSATWINGWNYAGNAPFTILDGTTVVGGEAMNQTEAPDDLFASSFYWEQVGQVVKITGTTLVVKVTNNANGYVIADAVRIDQLPAPQRPPRAEERLDYDTAGNLQRHVSEIGQVTTWEFNSLDELIETVVQDPDGLGPLPSPRTRYVRDLAGNVLSTFDTAENGAETETAFEYTPQGWVKKITRGANTSDSAVTEWKYDEWGRAIEETIELDSAEGDDRVTTWDYDDLPEDGSLPFVTITLPDPDGTGGAAAPVYVRTFDLRGNLVQLVEPDPDGSGTVYVSPVTDMIYDRMDRLETVTGATVNSVRPVTTFTYNKAGQVLSVVAPENRDTVNTYDDFSRLLTVTDELNHTTTLAYDRASNVVSVKDHLNQFTSHTVDARDRRISTTDPLEGVTRFSYDASGAMLSLTDAEQNTTRWSHDHLGRVICETNALGATRVTVYDSSGNVSKVVDRNGLVREFSHDALYRQTEERWKDGTTTIRTISFAYNDADEMLTVSDSDSAYALTYDNMGRPIEVDNDGTPGVPNVVLASGFDALSRRTTLSSTIASTADFLNTYSFDALHRLTRLDQTGQSGGNTVAEKRVDFAYNLAGQFTEIARFKDTDGGSGNEVATSAFDYDALGRLEELAHKKGGSNLFTAYAWSFDTINRVTQFVSQDGTNNYTYDATSQLLTASLTSESYSFDATGNRTTTGYVTGANNQLAEDSTFEFEYDGEGNRLTRTRKSTDPADDHLVEYAWDYRQRLAAR